VVSVGLRIAVAVAGLIARRITGVTSPETGE
jgi:hypothetical protein